MSSIKSWTQGLRGKLLLSACLPIFAFTALTAVSLRGMNELGNQLTYSYTEVVPNLDALAVTGMQRARIGYFVWAALNLKEDIKNRTTFIEKAESAFDSFKKGQKSYEDAPLTPETEKAYAEVKSHKDEFYKMTEDILADLKKNTPEADARVKVLMNGGRWHILATEIQKMMETSIKSYRDLTEKKNAEQVSERKRLTQLLVLMSAFCCFALFGVLMWVAYRISNSVGGIASNLSEAGGQVSGAISQLTSAGQTLSQASTEAAASLEETVASLEEMSSMVKMNSDNAKQAAALSQSSKDAAEEGQREIQTLIASMEEISKSSKKIEEIISVIDDIAFQTNLLALNASVEAARAGEQGKGFAVVAEAVRALAQRSAVAAKDINVLIKESVEKVDKGSNVADRSGQVLNNIVTSVKKVADLNNEISAASSEQTTGIQQISKAMNQLDQSTQANAASSEEIAASSEEISAQAQQMSKLTLDLKSVVLGDSLSTSPQERPSASPRHTASRHSSEKTAVKSGPIKKSAPETSEASNVIPMKAKKASANLKAPPKNAEKKSQQSAAVIPFDDDEQDERAKVGTTDGF